MPVLEVGRPGRSRFRRGAARDIERHFQAYVDDGRLPGWSMALGAEGSRDTARLRPARRGVRPPGRGRHAVADLLDDQAGHLGGRDEAVGGGAFELKDPVSASSRSGSRAGVREGTLAQAGRDAGRREPVRMWHLLTHTVGPDLRIPLRAPGGRAVPRAGFRVDDARGRRPGGLLRALGRALPAVRAGEPSGTTPWRPTSWDASSRCRRRAARPRLSPSGSSSPWAWRPGFWAGEDDATGWPPCTRPTRAPVARGARRSATGRWRPPDCLSGGGGLSRRLGLPPLRRDAAPGRRARRRPHPRPADRALHDAQPPPGRAAWRRSAARCSPRRRSTASASGSASRWRSIPSPTGCPAHRGVRLGRRGQHVLLVDPAEEITALF